MKVFRKQDRQEAALFMGQLHPRQEGRTFISEKHSDEIHHCMAKAFHEVEVTNISKHGLWLCTRDSELFISFKEFPQFLDASVSKILNVEQPNPNSLYWPDLDIDLAVRVHQMLSTLVTNIAPNNTLWSTSEDGTYHPTEKRSAFRSPQNVTQRPKHQLSKDSTLS